MNRDEQCNELHMLALHLQNPINTESTGKSYAPKGAASETAVFIL